MKSSSIQKHTLKINNKWREFKLIEYQNQTEQQKKGTYKTIRKYPPTHTSPSPNLNIKLNTICDPETQKTKQKI